MWGPQTIVTEILFEFYNIIKCWNVDKGWAGGGRGSESVDKDFL